MLDPKKREEIKALIGSTMKELKSEISKPNSVN